MYLIGIKRWLEISIQVFLKKIKKFIAFSKQFSPAFAHSKFSQILIAFNHGCASKGDVLGSIPAERGNR